MSADGRTGTPRCTHRKHVIENGRNWCDCGELLAGKTAAGNALVVTIIDPVQADALAQIQEAERG